MKQFEERVIGTPEKMKADFEILKMCFDLPEFHKLQKDTTGKVQNLMQPAYRLYELCVNVISQKHYTAFSEAQQNNSGKEEKKIFECSLLMVLKTFLSRTLCNWGFLERSCGHRQGSCTPSPPHEGLSPPAPGSLSLEIFEFRDLDASKSPLLSP